MVFCRARLIRNVSQTAIMGTIEEFQTTLMARLLSDPLPDGLVKEGDLERKFVLPLISDLQEGFTNLHVYAHPWKQSATCLPNCTDGLGLIAGPPPHGCQDCWENSKSWAAVRLHGLHCFDLVVGAPGNSLVLELKLLHRARKGNRKANDGFQRLVGQCALARLVHSRVIGFCVAEDGALGLSEPSLVDKLQEQAIWICVRPLDGLSV
jgi:hypothetical protein